MRRYKDDLDFIWSASKTGKKGPIIGTSMIVLGCILFALTPILIGLMIDKFTQRIEDDIIFSIDDVFSPLVVAIVLMIAWYILIVAGRTKLYRDYSSTRIRDALVQKFDKLPAEYFQRHPIGSIGSLITEDIPAVMRIATTHFPSAIAQAATITFIVAMMCLSNIYLGLIYLILTVLSFFITWKLGRSVRSYIKRRQASISKMNGLFSDSMNNHSMLKSYRLEGKAKRRFAKMESEREVSIVRSNNASSYIEPFGRIIDNTGYIASALIGVYMISNGLLTTGMFLSFISYATIIGRPIVTFLDSIYQMQDGSVSMDRITSVLKSKELPDETGLRPLDVDDIKGNISFENVSFGYTKDRLAVDRISFDAKAGTITTLVGVAGSGKSTITDLLMKYRMASEGRITIDGIDINDIRRDDLRKVIGVSPQVPWIFEGTIADNIGYSKEGATREEIIEASKAVGFDEFVMKHPEGYDKMLGDGCGLSSGEMQLLSLARLALYDPKIVILDDSTSDVDPITRYGLINKAEDWLYGKTVIISATDVSSMIIAHNVVYMRSGKIDDMGIHSELMSRNEDYAELFRSMIVA